MSVNPFDDGLLHGTLDTRKQQDCGACGKRGYCIYIIKITLPEGVKPLGTFVLYRFEQGKFDHEVFLKPLQYIGVTCGCYAKAHRQIAHITTNRKRRARRTT